MFLWLTFVSLGALCVVSPLGATEPGSDPATGVTDVLSRIDRLVSFLDTDYSAEYTITQSSPGQGSSTTRAALFRRDAADTYTIIILAPQRDRGKGYLKIGNNLWLYDPTSRRFTVTSARDRFENSNARNSDFTRSTLAEDYRIVGSRNARLGGYSTTVYDLEATTDDVTFPAMRIWVDENDLVRKYEDYSLSGRLLRTTAVPTYQRVGDRYVPVSIVIVDALEGAVVEGEFVNERTVITVERPSLQELPDIVFSQAYLERVSSR